VQVDPIKPTLKAPETNLFTLTLNFDVPLSSFAFTFDLRRHIKAGDTVAGVDKPAVSRCRWNR